MDDGTKQSFTRIFIRSTLKDNKILTKSDPNYELRLRSMHDKALVEAWLSGKWNVFVGQAFNFGERHIIDPIWPIPDGAPLYMTMDWGFGAPFSVGWWWVDGDDRLYRFAEWYGWDGFTPNKGLRLTDMQIAAGIVNREKEMGIWGRDITRLAGPDCFNKKPDYKGGGQGESTADEFVKFAQLLRTNGKSEDKNAKLTIYPGDPKRELKIKQFRNRLLIPENPNELPMMVVYRTCKDFIRIIPSLCVDDRTQEYLENGQELHPFDDACHVCMARPRTQKTMQDEEYQLWKQKMSKLDTASRAAAKEYDEIIDTLINPQELDDDLFF